MQDSPELVEGSTDHAFVEPFYGPLRDESLHAPSFLLVADARAKIGAWRRDYNKSRPHTSLGRLTPVEYAAAAGKIWVERTLERHSRPG